MRLQLTRRGDYAVRAMLALSAVPDGEVLSARSLAEAMSIPTRFMPAVMSDLAHAGLVRARAGRSGGYHLTRPAELISLLEVIEAVEGDSRRATCVLRDEACRSASGTGECAIHRFFFAAQDALLTVLRGATLAEMRGRRRAPGTLRRRGGATRGSDAGSQGRAYQDEREVAKQDDGGDGGGNPRPGRIVRVRP